MAFGEGGLIIFYTIPPDEIFLCIIESRSVNVLPTVTAVGLEIIFDDTLAPRTDSKAVSVFVDADCVQCHGQAVCRGEQQVRDGVGKRTLLRGVLPDIIGFLRMDLFESKLHFIITSALKHR